jgi:dienelactone hydrolase
MASIIQGYKYDIFISYRQKDNKYDGWVTEFVDNLKRELEATFKEEVSVYFDINPLDGLLETHDVDASLKEKTKCLVCIPIISRTYCDPKSFAWEHEFKTFIEQASNDPFGLKVTLQNGNVANRVLPVRIHDLDIADIKLFESILGGVLRSVDFVYKETGVNRQLRSRDDDAIKNPNQILYRDQINKVALAVRDIIEGMKAAIATGQVKDNDIQVTGSPKKKEPVIEEPVRKDEIKSEPEVRIEKNKTVRPKRIYGRIQVIVIISIILILGLIGARLYYNQKKRQYARYELIPQIQKMMEENFTAPVRTFELATEAEKYISDDSILISLWSEISNTSSLQTQPEGASVLWKDYDRPEDPWKLLGITPLRNFRIPKGAKRIQIEKDGFQTILLTSLGLIGPGLDRLLKLDSIGILPENMVRVPSRVAPMLVVGLETMGKKRVGEFLADRFEVTNKEYQRFVDSGGYNNKIYWNYPVYKEGKEMSWESAMNIFVDKTGKKAPAGWEVGKYPDGQENYPVAGISWYEASAYATFAGKKLPTVYHWSIIAEIGLGMKIIPLSNYNGKSTVPVGSMEGMSSYGIYDLAGNVREWCNNGNGEHGESYILGGGWNDPTYSFRDAGIQPSIDRSLSNGFRCIKDLPGDTTFGSLAGPFVREFRDYRKEKPVDDKTFNIFLRQYSYDNLPLNPKITAIENPGNWKVEKVTIDAGYNKERLDIYLFFPKNAQPPYQPVIFFPGSNVIFTPSFTINEMKPFEFIVKSGRVLAFPILKGTFERKDDLKSDMPEETVFYKDHVIMWRRDIGRTIDYLETRDDLLSDKVGYFGFSWGGLMGSIIPAVDKRLNAIVLNVGGMGMNKTLPEVDQINFLPRINQPVLMLNGKYDSFFPVETSQKPMFDLLGTPAKDKNLIIYDTGHLVPKTELIKETLAWYDKYLGPVK